MKSPTKKSAAANEVRNRLEIVLSDLLWEISHNTIAFPTMVTRPGRPNHVDKTIFAAMVNVSLSQQVLFIFAMTSVFFYSKAACLQRTPRSRCWQLCFSFGSDRLLFKVSWFSRAFNFLPLVSLWWNTFLLSKSHDTTKQVKCGWELRGKVDFINKEKYFYIRYLIGTDHKL